MDDLEILDDVEEITGILEVDVQHPNLTSLSFLTKLRVIEGVGAEWVLYSTNDTKQLAPLSPSH